MTQVWKFRRFSFRVRVWWAWLRVRHWFIAPFLRRECLHHPYWESRDVTRKGKGTGPVVRKWADDSLSSTSEGYVRPTPETVYFCKPPGLGRPDPSTNYFAPSPFQDGEPPG